MCGFSSRHAGALSGGVGWGGFDPWGDGVPEPRISAWNRMEIACEHYGEPVDVQRVGSPARQRRRAGLASSINACGKQVRLCRWGRSSHRRGGR